MTEDLLSTINLLWLETPLRNLSDRQISQLLAIIAPEQWARIGGEDFPRVITGAYRSFYVRAECGPTRAPESELAELLIEDMAERIAIVLNKK